MIIITVVVSILLILLVCLTISRMSNNNNCGCKEEDYSNTENINKRIDRAVSNYRSDLSKYNVSAKSYKYDFVPNEQPLNGLSPDYNQNYPSTLQKSNKMFVIPDFTIKYDNLLNTPNNAIKNYIY